jgi:hypothetical protein
MIAGERVRWPGPGFTRLRCDTVRAPRCGAARSIGQSGVARSWIVAVASTAGFAMIINFFEETQ